MIKNKTIILIINSIFFLCILSANYQLLIPKTVKAQTVPLQSLRVTPIINDLKLFSGSPTTFRLTIQNLSKDPVGIHIDISGYDQIGEIPIIEQKPSAIINWTHVSKHDLLLAPHSSQAISVTINTPSHLPSSGYYETIFLTPIVNQDITPNSPIILSRIGTLVLGTIGTLNYDDLAKKVAVTNFTPSHTIINSFPKTLLFTVTNKYFTHFDAKPFLTITPLFGTSQTTLLPDKHVLPNSARIWQYQPTIPTNRIFYHMHLSVSVGDGKKVLSDTWFVVIPYKLFIIVVLLAFILFKRNHITKATKILFKG
jgi:hypothetical protein